MRLITVRYIHFVFSFIHIFSIKRFTVENVHTNVPENNYSVQPHLSSFNKPFNVTKWGHTSSCPHPENLTLKICRVKTTANFNAMTNILIDEVLIYIANLITEKHPDLLHVNED